MQTILLMAKKMTEECINCGACEPDCPNNAIYERSVEWPVADGTTLSGTDVLIDESILDGR